MRVSSHGKWIVRDANPKQLEWGDLLATPGFFADLILGLQLLKFPTQTPSGGVKSQNWVGRDQLLVVIFGKFLYDYDGL